MYCHLINDLKVDIYNIPEDFEELVKESFKDYTSGTREEYMYQDKLCYIDTVVKHLHKANAEDAVMNVLHEHFDYCARECGEIPDESDFYNIEFMEQCYESGRGDSRLYSHTFAKDHHTNEKIMTILYRLIKTVMNYEGDE